MLVTLPQIQSFKIYPTAIAINRPMLFFMAVFFAVATNANGVEQHDGSVGRLIRGNLFQHLDLSGEETATTVRGTCNLEKNQVKNLNEKNTNLNLVHVNGKNTNLNEKNTNRNEQKCEPKRTGGTKAQNVGVAVTKNNGNGLVLDNVPPTNDDKLDHLVSGIACQERREECSLGKTGTTMCC